MSGGSREIYFPQNDHEKIYFDFLWDIANNRQPSPPGSTNLTGELSGLAAVTFFQRSGVDKGFLKQIWSLSTPVATMNVQQFYVALRFIAMIQNGEMPISKERLLATVKDKFELPKFNGIDIPAARPVAPIAVPSAGVPPATVAPGANFAITPQEHVKYHSLFVGYDKDHDGFLFKEEALPIFRQSGLDSFSVDQIWTIADDDRDNRLTSKEFSAAFHIIVCVSKRNQQLPTALPPALKIFLLNAPAIPGEIVGAVAAPGVVPVAAPGVVATATLSLPSANSIAPAPAPLEIKKQDISSAFGGFDEVPLSKPSTTAAEDSDILNSLDAVKAATKKTVAAHEQALEINEKAYSSFQGIRQRLATDRIALEATVKNAIFANNESNAKLDQITHDIAQLQEQIRQLTLKLQETSQTTTSTQDRIAKAQEEKQQLLREIDRLFKQLDQSQKDTSELAAKLTAGEREGARLETENKFLTASSASLKSNAVELSKENEELRRIAASLRERYSEASLSKQNLTTRVTLVNDRVTSEQAKNQELQRAVHRETKQVEVLKEEKRSLLHSISSPGQPAPSPIKYDDELIAAPSIKPTVSASSAKAFDDGDDPFGGFDDDDKSLGVPNGGFAKLEEENAFSKPNTIGISGFDDSDPFRGFGNSSSAAVTLTNSSEPSLHDDPFGGGNAFADSAVAIDPFSGFTAPSATATSPKPLSTKGGAKAVDPFSDNFHSEVSENFSEKDPFGGFDAAASGSPTKKDVAVVPPVADDPFSGFDDNVPLPKSLSPLPVSAPKSPKDPFSDFADTSTDKATVKPAEDAFNTPAAAFGSGKDPFADFHDPITTTATTITSSKAVEDPFSSPAGGFGDEKDPFSAFDETTTKAVTSTSTKALDDPFTSPVGGFGNEKDPFSFNHEASAASTRTDDDPFAPPVGVGEGFSKEKDPFLASDNLKNAKSDFGSFDSASSAKAADAFGGLTEDPFGSSSGFGTTATATTQKKVDDDDPFAGFD